MSELDKHAAVLRRLRDSKRQDVSIALSLLNKHDLPCIASIEDEAAALGAALSAMDDARRYRELVEAATTIYRLHNLGDAIYDVRERADKAVLANGESSWDHPDVKAYSDAVGIVEKHIPAPPQAAMAQDGGEGDAATYNPLPGTSGMKGMDR